MLTNNEGRGGRASNPANRPLEADHVSATDVGNLVIVRVPVNALLW